MAEKRMFNKEMISSDIFTSMPISTQALYFHLCMNADDEGFVDRPKNIMKSIGASEDDIKILLGKRYVLAFESGIIVIKHWYIHNWIRQDRIKPTKYQEELATLTKKENGTYTELSVKCQSSVSQVSDKCQASIGEYSIDKYSIDKINNNTRTFIPPTIAEVEEYCKERNNNVDANQFIDFYESKGWYVGKNKMKNWKACIRTWEQRSKTNKTIKANPKVLDREEYNKIFLESMEKMNNGKV